MSIEPEANNPGETRVRELRYEAWMQSIHAATQPADAPVEPAREDADPS